MKITPLDIRRQEFSRKFRGFDPDEVEAFLQTLADQYETVIRENAALKEQITRLDSQVSSFQNLEKTLRDTLISAQKARDEARSDATKEADCIVREAELRAERWIEEARQEVVSLRRELATLQSYKVSFVAKMKALLRSQGELINVLELDSQETRSKKDLLPPDLRAQGAAEGLPPEEPSVSLESQPPEQKSTYDPKGEAHPTPPPGPADGPRRPYRRFFGGRNSQDERQGSPGEG